MRTPLSFANLRPRQVYDSCNAFPLSIRLRHRLCCDDGSFKPVRSGARPTSADAAATRYSYAAYRMWLANLHEYNKLWPPQRNLLLAKVLLTALTQNVLQFILLTTTSHGCHLEFISQPYHHAGSSFFPSLQSSGGGCPIPELLSLWPRSS